MLRAVAFVATVVATTLVVEDGAFADPGNASHVDEVAAVVDFDGITVTGRATFVDVPGVVGEDATDDAVQPAAPLGHELTTATISRPDPFADMLRFAVEVKNQPPNDVNGVPEFVVYRWDFTVTTGGEKRDVVLRAWRSSLWTSRGSGSTSADPLFLLTTCRPSGGGCIDHHVLTGSMGEGIVAWNVPMGQDMALGQIGQVGTVITSNGIKVTSSVSGAVALVEEKEEGVLDDVTTDAVYAVPGPSVRMGIAPAGTPAQNIPLTANGTVDATGAFRGRLPAPATPGEYTVAVQACDGADSCGIATTNVPVS